MRHAAAFIIATTVSTTFAGEPPVPELTYLESLRPGKLQGPAIRAFVSDDGTCFATNHETISGTGGVYHRLIDGVWTKLLAAGQSAAFQGMSADGTVIATQVQYWTDATGFQDVPYRTSGTFVRGVSPDGTKLYGGLGFNNQISATVWDLVESDRRILPSTGFLREATCSSSSNTIIYGHSVFSMPLRWTNEIQDFAENPGPGSETLSDCNRAGDIAVGYGNDYGAFRLDDGFATLLSDPTDDGIVDVQAWSLNEDASLIVGMGTLQGTSTVIPLIWTDGGATLHRLTDWLEASGADLTGYNLRVATDISPDGRFIAAGGSFGGTNGGVLIDLGPTVEPCAPDLNADGELDFFDISELLMTSTDYNGDTAFDFFDISAFLQDLSTGCP